MFEETAGSWEELVAAVKKIEKKLRKANSSYGVDISEGDGYSANRFWYRGLPKLIYTLSPTLYRYRNGREQEGLLYKRFSQIPITNPAPRENSWERLMAMQHYQVPTRLLDWTEVLGVAAYFAAAPESTDRPCVYVMDALWLNAQSGTRHIQELPTTFPLDYETHYVGSDIPPTYEHPIAAAPTVHNDRSQRQQGCFTIHGINDRPLEIQFPQCLGRVILTEIGREEVRIQLDKMNLNAFTLFPDFEGLANWVKTNVGLEMPAYDQSLAELIKSSLREFHEQAKRVLSDAATESPCRPAPPAFAGLQFDNYVPRAAEDRRLREWAKPSQPRRFAIVDGPAGIGKTTFLLQTLVFEQPERVVFFPPKRLKDALQRGRRRFEDVLAEYVDIVVRDHLSERARTAVRRETIQDVAKEMIHSGELLVVLDGLDEVTRISDLDTVRYLIQDLVVFVGPHSKAKVAISCRDHILRQLQIIELLKRAREGERDNEIQQANDIETISLTGLDTDEVDKSISECSSQKVDPELEKLLCIPIFLKLITADAFGPKEWASLMKAPKTKSALYELWFRTVLKGVAPFQCDLSVFVDKAMEKLGETAIETLKRRIDHFDPHRLPADLHGLLRDDSARHLRILAKESDTVCSFAHQSLREFILARAVAKEITGKPEFHPLEATPSFDYIGAETYEFIKDLLKFPEDVLGKLKSLLAPVLRKTGKPDAGDARRWNSRARNLFEMIGMLAEPEHFQSEDREPGPGRLETFKELAGSLLGNVEYDGMYISYRVKQNVVRCLERLHPSAPMPYYESVLNREAMNSSEEYRSVYAYAIRGFRLASPRLSRHPVMLFKKEWERTEYPNYGELEKFVVDTLLDTSTRLIAQDMEMGANFLRVNASFALIRWLPKKFKWSRIEEAFPLNEPDKYIATNIFQCLEERNALTKVSREYQERIERYRYKP